MPLSTEQHASNKERVASLAQRRDNEKFDALVVYLREIAKALDSIGGLPRSDFEETLDQLVKS